MAHDRPTVKTQQEQPRRKMKRIDCIQSMLITEGSTTKPSRGRRAREVHEERRDAGGLVADAGGRDEEEVKEKAEGVYKESKYDTHFRDEREVPQVLRRRRDKGRASRGVQLDLDKKLLEPSIHQPSTDLRQLRVALPPGYAYASEPAIGTRIRGPSTIRIQFGNESVGGAEGWRSHAHTLQYDEKGLSPRMQHRRWIGVRYAIGTPPARALDPDLDLSDKKPLKLYIPRGIYASRSPPAAHYSAHTSSTSKRQTVIDA
ncbi:hypothetical protein R3P38DRAFT_2811396 [Favolaschia claudopus]|uniref:Uncharacterized protein n=1 Tax=Favolaschia claudopus TaxID=2862362 RepID=A0AAV9Z9H1_9AGAR